MIQNHPKFLVRSKIIIIIIQTECTAKVVILYVAINTVETLVSGTITCMFKAFLLSAPRGEHILFLQTHIDMAAIMLVLLEHL